jgi:hypothetical protein
MTDTQGKATAEDIDALKEQIKKSNDDRKIESLMRKAQKAHDWRVQVWAQSERRIRGFNAQLEVIGAPAYEPFEPDFKDDAMLEHYATMPLK